MNFSNRETTSAKKRKQLKVSDVLDVIDNGPLGVEIIFNDYSKLSLQGEAATHTVQDLKAQIRARKDWADRSEHWEGYESLMGVFVNNPQVMGRVYSFSKEIAILNSRMTRQEREQMNG